MPVRSAQSASINHAGKRLFVGGERNVRRTVLVRAVMVLVMFALVIGIFWADRSGLRDQADGEVSFADVVYFSMVTVTTVGYGDIVPVATRARMVDAVLVTPIRLLIWFIFLGTTYQLVLQRLIEDWRMRRLQSRLEHHVVVCGFGHSGACAAHELAHRGMDKQQIVIVDRDRGLLEAAAEQGFIGILGDATREETLRQAMLPSARALFVCTDRDDTNVLIVLTARQLSPSVRIVARVEEAENDKLLRQSGANTTILPSRVGGILMAGSLETSALAAYVMDLISATGRVLLVERAVASEEVGLKPEQVAHGTVVGVLRGTQELPASEPQLLLEAGDRLLVIRQSSSTESS